MKILGIESSCDETAAAVVEDGSRLLSNVVASSMDLHVRYGGVVPEIAARSHIEVIDGVIQQALEDAHCTWQEIDAIAVTYGPGLGGSLLIGVLAARTLAIVHQKPLYAINHVEAHVYANFLTEAAVPRATSHEPRKEHASKLKDGERNKPEHSEGGERSEPEGGELAASEAMRPPEGRLDSPQSTATCSITHYHLPKSPPLFPALALIVSGGHTQLALFRDHFDYTLLGQTQDDAVGEAFDKVAKIIGLPYPGGPSVSQAAITGNPHTFHFPKAKMTSASPELAALRQADNRTGPSAGLAPVRSAGGKRGEPEVEQGRHEQRDVSPEEEPAPPRKIPASYDFSFSGLKTAVLRTAQELIGENFNFPSKDIPARLTGVQQADIAASFQRVAIETVVDKTLQAYEEFGPKSVIIAGGVAANRELRRQLAERLPLPIEYADPKLCTDNGAMIAALGCFHMKYSRPTTDPYTLDIAPNLSM